MPLRIVDHNDPDWARRFAAHGRMNGAATYSREIVKYQIPVWAEWLATRHAVISTCPVLVGREVKADIVVQYLHTYSYASPLVQAHAVAKNVDANRLIFVTAYAALHHQLRAAGFHSIHVPMTVDVARVQQHQKPQTRGPRDIAYYGNITAAKRRTFLNLRHLITKAGWRIYPIEDEQGRAWERASTYRYGIGVGRCALELMALGVKVIYAGQEFGGIATTLEEYQCQWDCNFNGRVTTYDRDPLVCLRSIDLSIPYPTGNVDQATTTLALEIGRALNEEGT